MSTKFNVALVTGASAGLGREIVLYLARGDRRVVACARTKSRLRELVRDAEAHGAVIDAQVCDVTRDADVKRLAAYIRKRYGKLDFLVNNAGGHQAFGKLEQLSVADWEQAYDINVLSAVRMTLAMLPLLRKSTRDPGIVNVASAVAFSPGAFHPHYAAAKAALVNFSKYLAKQYGSEGIRVNTVAPGSIYGEAWDRNVKACARDLGISRKEAEKLSRKRQLGKIPLGRIGWPGDVAAAVAYLASGEANWISGACIPVDGGATP